PMPSRPMIGYARVTKSFGPLKAVDDLSLDIAEGEFLAVVGGSGSGKTTLLRLANRLIEADGGTITIEGDDVHSVDPVALRRRIVLMDEPFGALDPLTRDALGDDFRELHRGLGLTTVMITHDMTEAILLADRIALMRSGELLAQGTPAELSKSSDAYVLELLRTPRRQVERLNALLPQSGAA